MPLCPYLSNFQSSTLLVQQFSPGLPKPNSATDRIPEGRIALDTAVRMGLPASALSPTVLLYANFYERKGDYPEAGKLLSSLPPESISEDLTAFMWIGLNMIRPTDS